MKTQGKEGDKPMKPDANKEMQEETAIIINNSGSGQTRSY